MKTSSNHLDVFLVQGYHLSLNWEQARQRFTCLFLFYSFYAVGCTSPRDLAKGCWHRVLCPGPFSQDVTAPSVLQFFFLEVHSSLFFSPWPSLLFSFICFFLCKHWFLMLVLMAELFTSLPCPHSLCTHPLNTAFWTVTPAIALLLANHIQSQKQATLPITRACVLLSLENPCGALVFSYKHKERSECMPGMKEWMNEKMKCTRELWKYKHVHSCMTIVTNNNTPWENSKTTIYWASWSFEFQIIQSLYLNYL